MSLQALALAFALLTRLPVPLPGSMSEVAQGRAVAAYPFVGLVIGLMLGGTAWAAQVLSLDAGVTAFAVLLFWVGITGAIHLDGAADSADGWLGGLGDRERTLRIMKDPVCGSAGVVAVGLILLGKWVALEQLIVAEQLWALVLAPLLARAAGSWLFLVLPYAVDGGMASGAVRHLPRREVWIAVLLSSCSVLPFDALGLLMLIATVVVAALGVRLMVVRLGGFTGDTTGALVEAVELGALLALAGAV